MHQTKIQKPRYFFIHNSVDAIFPSETVPTHLSIGGLANVSGDAELHATTDQLRRRPSSDVGRHASHGKNVTHTGSSKIEFTSSQAETSRFRVIKHARQKVRNRQGAATTYTHCTPIAAKLVEHFTQLKHCWQ